METEGSKQNNEVKEISNGVHLRKKLKYKQRKRWG